MPNKFFQELIVKPFKRNLAGAMFWFGLLFVFLGAIFAKEIDLFPFVPNGTGEALLKGGSAILGAGVFAVIMKSSQFTELFQNHISAVFYDPSSVKDGVPLIVKWRLITSALLKEVLPTAHNNAVTLIEQQFFNSEREYHFEDHKITYEITVDIDTSIATVKHQTESIIVLSPHAINPQLDQSIETEGKCDLISLRLNNKDCNKTELFKADTGNPKLYQLTFPLKDYAVSGSKGNDKIVKLDRVQSWTQDLKADPYIYANISRYIKGATVKAKISDGYKLEFLKFGLGELPDNHYVADDGMGFARWQLAEPNCLLLPGQGFIIIPVAL